MKSSKIIGGISLFVLLTGAIGASAAARGAAEAEKFTQDIRTEYTQANGLPADAVHDVALTVAGRVWAATSKGVTQYNGKTWAVPQGGQSVDARSLAVAENGDIWAAGPSGLHHIDSTGVIALSAKSVGDLQDVTVTGRGAFVAGTRGLFRARTELSRDDALFQLMQSDGDAGVTAVASTGSGSLLAAASASHVYLLQGQSTWTRLDLHDGTIGWQAPAISDLALGPAGRNLWAACRQGAARYDLESKAWQLIGPDQGLPYDELTSVAVGGDGSTWFGTPRGAIRYDGEHFAYRAGRRWLPNDEVRNIAVQDDGTAWIATAGGVSRIERRPMTFAEKAAHYETIIDARHRRLGYVIGANLKGPGDTSEVSHHDSDNDGLWTGMYGAGECFRYGATQDPAAKKAADGAFAVLNRLHEVTGIRGFPARSVLPIDAPDPNLRHGHTVEGQKASQQRDHLWKVITPRWPKSADGKWYWKCDTSSDEIDGHYFFYAAYYDLVAESDEEKNKARRIIVDMTDYIVDNDFYLLDHDGKPTRWGMWNPEKLNNDIDWVAERGLNSLEMLSFLATAHHVSGDRKYLDVTRELVDKHHYAQNMQRQKVTFPSWRINNSDDEMAFMCYYNLIRYTKDEALLALYRSSLRHNWMWERPERNPLFNFIYGACGSEPFDRDAAVDGLRRFPWEMFDWRMTNSHRKDVEIVGAGLRRGGSRLRLADLPPMLRPPGAYRKHPPYGVMHIDERYFGHWNHNPYPPDTGGSGSFESDGANFLLPYYLGLFHGYVK